MSEEPKNYNGIWIEDAEAKMLYWDGLVIQDAIGIRYYYNRRMFYFRVHRQQQKWLYQLMLSSPDDYDEWVTRPAQSERVSTPTLKA